MSTVSQNNPDFLNTKSIRVDNIKLAFSQWLDRPMWVLSGPDKCPRQIDGKAASVSDPSTWATFDVIEPHITDELLPTISLDGSGLCVIDLDNCIDEQGSITKEASRVTDRMSQYSYVEKSRSGSGFHLIFIADKPARNCKTKNFEVYDSNDSKFITLTGNLVYNWWRIGCAGSEFYQIYFRYFPESSNTATKDLSKNSPPLSNAEVIALLNKASNKEKFSKLFYDGVLDSYGDDASSADFALVSLIAFYTQKKDQIFSIFQESALYKSPARQAKWARDDYRTGTIAKAINSCRAFYQPIRAKGADPRKGTWEHPAWPEIGGDPIDEPFPVHCLPEVMQRAVQEVARDVRVDPAMAAVSAIGALALVTGKRATVVEKIGLEHFPSLFLLCIALPVERKSEAYKRILDPLRDLLELDIAEWEEKRRRSIAHNESIQEQSSAIKSKIRETAKHPGDSKQSLEDLKERLIALHGNIQEIPAHPRNWADDSTPEKLKKNLYQHKGEFGLFSAEGRTILHTIQNPDGQNATAKSLYTSAVWGDTLDRDRITGGEAGEGERWELRHPALTIVAFVQPDAWKSFSEDPIMRGNGTLSRICVARPRSLVGSRMESENEPPYNIGEVLPFVTLLDRIRKWRPERAIRVPLSEEAARARRRFFNAWEVEIGPGGAYEDVADLVGRSASITSRLSLLLAIAHSAEKNSLGQPLEITLKDWINAQEIEEWFMTNGIDSLRSQSRSHEDCESRVFTWLCKELHSGEKEFLASTLRNRCRLTKEETAQVISSFESRGVIKVGRKSRGKSFYYDINPQIPEVNQYAED